MHGYGEPLTGWKKKDPGALRIKYLLLCPPGLLLGVYLYPTQNSLVKHDKCSREGGGRVGGKNNTEAGGVVLDIVGACLCEYVCWIDKKTCIYKFVYRGFYFTCVRMSVSDLNE